MVGYTLLFSFQTSEGPVGWVSSSGLRLLLPGQLSGTTPDNLSSICLSTSPWLMLALYSFVSLSPMLLPAWKQNGFAILPKSEVAPFS